MRNVPYEEKSPKDRKKRIMNNEIEIRIGMDVTHDPIHSPWVQVKSFSLLKISVS